MTFRSLVAPSLRSYLGSRKGDGDEELERRAKRQSVETEVGGGSV